MAITIGVPKAFKANLLNGNINFGSEGTNVGQPHNFKIALMSTSFQFDKATQASYADIVNYELSNGYGYLKGDRLINPLSLVFDVEYNYTVNLPILYWTASGGNIGPFKGACIYDDNGATNATKYLVCYVDFGVNNTIEANNLFYLYDINIRLA